MEEAISEHGLTIAGSGVYGGSSMWMQAEPGIDMAAVARSLMPQSVLVEPGAPFFAQNNRQQNYYRLGYSSIAESRIEPGLALLAKALQSG